MKPYVEDARSIDVNTMLRLQGINPFRQIDIVEWVGATGKPISQTLPASVEDPNSFPRALIGVDGTPICMWGVTVRPDIGEHAGVVWLIATVAAERHSKAIHRLWRKEIDLMHSHAETLVALVYERNDLHKKWLKVVGFKPLSTPSPLVGFKFYGRYQAHVR